MGVLQSQEALTRSGQVLKPHAVDAPAADSLFVAFLLLTAAEQLGGSDPEGKRKRFLWRAVAALSYGTLWFSLIGG